MRARHLLGLASLVIGCGPVAENDDGVVTGTDETTAATTMPTMTTMTTMTTVAATTGGPIDETTSAAMTDPGLDSTTGEPPGTSTGDPSETTDTGDSTGATTGEVGTGECTVHDDCASGYCREFSDAPPDPESLCQDPPAGGSTRFTGTVRDIVTLQPVDDADIIVTGALQALTNPTGASALVSATTDGEGQFDATSPMAVSRQIGAIAIASSLDHYLTETGVAGPELDGAYPPGNTIHDVWVVHNDDLVAWTNLLQADGADPTALPLGESGGFILIVRDAAGEPVSGASVVSTEGGSSSVVYYPSSDSTSLVGQTSDLGIAIVINSALAEVFTVQAGGSNTQITSGSVDQAVFAAGVITG